METLQKIDISKPVQVYRNPNKRGCLFSVRQGQMVRWRMKSKLHKARTIKSDERRG